MTSAWHAAPTFGIVPHPSSEPVAEAAPAPVPAEAPATNEALPVVLEPAE
jgi:hypothetical protein